MRRIFARLAVVAGLAMAAVAPAYAQDFGTAFDNATSGGQQQMLLEADKFYYSNNDEVVSAVGNVRIVYRGILLTSQRVTYSRSSGRVIATGNVEIIERNGSHVFAEEIDVTDDFSDGFVSSLRMQTAENTRFAAESAERSDGEITVFNNGVYTACEPCKDDPSKPPMWQIRAKKAIINNRTKIFEYRGASFEFYGHPIAYLPYFSHADPAIKRKTGFLVPQVSYTNHLGTGVKNAFFWNMAPNYDLTFTGTYYTNQGFLGEAEWRHRTYNGKYNLRIAGISQNDPAEFGASTIDAANTDRMAIMSKGAFDINSRWRFGWNALWQNDNDFAQTYSLRDYSADEVINQIYLTGLDGKNFFDLRAQQFLVQDSRLDQGQYFPSKVARPGNQLLQEQQGNALPTLDYNRVSDYPVAGGEVSLDVNVRNINRKDWQAANYDAGIGKATSERFHGIKGDSGRATLEAEWKRSEIFSGSVITASLSGQADGIWQDTDNLSSVSNPLTSNDSLWRAMPAGMLEIRYPLVAQDGFASHMLEPIAQIVTRPDETQIGKFPNEDAQSFVFDTTNLFERNKFSGYDRVEGGTRANVGFRYSASYLNGATLNVAAGQSFHLAGKNSFAQTDLVNAGLESGLETNRSDYVASASINNGNGLSFGVSGRFDEKDLEIRRGEATLGYNTPYYGASGSYVYIGAQPNYGFSDTRHEFNGQGSVKLTENWSASASFSYDLEYATLYQHGIGLAYDDSCFSFSVTYNRLENRYTGKATDTYLLFQVGLRTIGNYEYSYGLPNEEEDQ